MARRPFPPPSRWVTRPRFYTAPNKPDLTIPVPVRVKSPSAYWKLKRSRIRRGRFFEPPAPITVTPFTQALPPSIVRRAPAYGKIVRSLPRSGNFWISDPGGDDHIYPPIRLRYPAQYGKIVRSLVRSGNMWISDPGQDDHIFPVAPRTKVPLRLPRFRSGQFFEAIASSVAAPTTQDLPPAIVRQARRVWPTRARSGNFLADVTPVQLSPADPVTRNRLWPPRARSGQFFEAPAAPLAVTSQALPPSVTRPVRRTWPTRARAGAFLTGLLPGQVTPTVQALPPSTVRPVRRTESIRARVGRFFAPPGAGTTTPTVQALPPALSRQARRIQPSRVRFGRFVPVPPNPAPAVPAPTPLGTFRAPRRPVPAARHGRYTSVPATPGTPVPSCTRRARVVPAVRHAGRFAGTPFPPAVVVPNPPWCPLAGQADHRRHRPKWARRGKTFSPFMVGAPPSIPGALVVVGDSRLAGVVGDSLTSSVVGNSQPGSVTGNSSTTKITGDGSSLKVG